MWSEPTKHVFSLFLDRFEKNIQFCEFSSIFLHYLALSVFRILSSANPSIPQLGQTCFSRLPSGEDL